MTGCKFMEKKRRWVLSYHLLVIMCLGRSLCSLNALAEVISKIGFFDHLRYFMDESTYT